MLNHRVGSIKLNTDGSFLGNPGVAEGGGASRGHKGQWLRGFSHAIGVTTTVQAKLGSLKDGLSMALDMGITFLEIERYSLTAIELIKSNKPLMLL